MCLLSTVSTLPSCLPEILNLSERILARQKRIEEFTRSEVTGQKIMYAAVHSPRFAPDFQ